MRFVESDRSPFMTKRIPLLLLAAAFGCVTTAQEGEQMRADIADLRLQLKKDHESAQAERDKLVAEQAQKAKQLQEALDALNRAARKSGADLAVDLEKAQNDVTALRGQLEVLQHRIEQAEKVNQDQQKQLEEAGKFVAQRKQELEHPTDRTGLYNLAKQRLDQGQTQKARELFGEFVQKFPKDELADNAQYWLGESFYAEKRYDDAIVEFQKVIKQHKGSEKIPDAVLKIGMSFQAQGDCQNALLFFDDVQQSHKGTDAAKVARERAVECRKKKR